VDDIFKTIDEEGNGNGVVSRDELFNLFQGNRADTEFFMSKMAAVEGNELNLEQWCVFMAITSTWISCSRKIHFQASVF